MNEQKTIKDYTVEELKGILVGTKADILDTQEVYNTKMQALTNNRQVIEQELAGREKEEKPSELTPKGHRVMADIKEAQEKGKTKKTK